MSLSELGYIRNVQMRLSKNLSYFYPMMPLLWSLKN